MGGAIPPFLALLVRFRGKTVAARDRRGDIGIPLLLEHLALPLGGEKPSKMIRWQAKDWPSGRFTDLGEDLQ